MTIGELKKYFFEQLKNHYPQEEISSFFNLLAEDYLKLSRVEAVLQKDKDLSDPELKQFKKAISRLEKQEPVQYILGKTEFFGLPFEVNPNVLIPRPETEELVAWILSEVKNKKGLKILDIGTGSGCIAISLAKNLPDAVVIAVDISEKALNTGRKNAEKNNVKVDFRQEDILKIEKLQEDFDIIVSNPPYVRELEKEEMQDNVLKNEPATALYVQNEDPLIFYEKIAFLASGNLRREGNLFFEINQYLAEETEAVLKKYHFKTRLKKDIFGNFRMLKAVQVK